jgi:hypothetical protein
MLGKRQPVPVLHQEGLVSAFDIEFLQQSSDSGPESSFLHGFKETAEFGIQGPVDIEHFLSGKDILYSFDKVKDKLKPYTLHEMSIVNEGIFRLLEVERVPADKKEDVKKNLDAYFDYLVKERKEAAAHFANLYVQQTYPDAVAFIARECQVLTMTLVLYVESIR